MGGHDWTPARPDLVAPVASSGPRGAGFLNETRRGSLVSNLLLSGPVLADRSFSELFPDPESTPEGGEQRTNPRAATLLPVRVTCDEAAFTATCVELSCGGILLRTQGPLASGTTVQLEIALPKGPVFVGGTVRWARVDDEGIGEVGVQLVAVSERAALSIATYRTAVGASTKADRVSA
jgi:PilZ domain